MSCFTLLPVSYELSTMSCSCHSYPSTPISYQLWAMSCFCSLPFPSSYKLWAVSYRLPAPQARLLNFSPYFLTGKMGIDFWLFWCCYKPLSWKSPQLFNSNPCHQPPEGWSWWNISSGFTSSLRQRKGLVSDRRLFVFKHNGLLTTYNGHCRRQLWPSNSVG